MREGLARRGLLRQRRSLGPHGRLWPVREAVWVVTHLLGRHPKAVVRLRRLVDGSAVAISLAHRLARYVLPGPRLLLIQLTTAISSIPTLVQQSLQAIDEAVVILVAIEDVKDSVDELVLLLDESIQQVLIFFIVEVVASQLFNELEQLLFVLRNGRHWPLDATKGRC